MRSESHSPNPSRAHRLQPLGRLRDFPAAEEGTQAIEVLLIIAFTVVPCFWAILLLEGVLREFLGVETVILTSPFF